MSPGVGGQIQGIGLDSFLQMAQMERTTCTLTIRHGNETGCLYISKGNLFAAETGELKNKDAVYEIISWNHVVIEIENACIKTENEINQPLMNLLMEGLRLRDEKTAQKKTDMPQELTLEPPDILMDPLGASPSAGAPIENKAEAPAPVQEQIPEEDFKDLSKPAEKIDRQEPYIEVKEKTAPSSMPAKQERVAPPSTPAPYRKKPALLLTGGVILALVVIAAGAVIGLGLFKTDGAERDFTDLTTKLAVETDLNRQLNALQAFLDRYSSGQYADQARTRMNEIRLLQEEQEFDSLMADVSRLPIDENYEQNAVARFNQYLSKYPGGIYAEDIQLQISKIRDKIDDADYKNLTGADAGNIQEQIARYDGYLDKHPKGKYRAAVLQLKSRMGDRFYRYMENEIAACNQQKQWESCINLCSFFTTSFTRHPLLEKVVEMKIRLEGQRDLAALEQAAAEKGKDFHAARQIYTAYLNQHPDSIHKARITAELDDIDQNIRSQDEWRQVAAFGKNAQFDVADRLNRVQTYVEKTALGPYAREANTLLDQLRAEKRTADRQRQQAAAEKEQRVRLQAEKEQIAQEAARKKGYEQHVIAQIEKTGGRFRAGAEGTVTDTVTGLMWTLLDSHLDLGKCLKYSTATAYVEGLKTGGYNDWRLPTPSELAGIYKSKPYFPASGAAWYWSSESYIKGFYDIANVVTSNQESIYRTEQRRHGECGAIRAVRP